ncbi:MAG TPA: AMP-binding protein [Steroidobacteraceae bacterium]|nr:AMP-binding protein [Steroidobacteraceae bacterium]
MQEHRPWLRFYGDVPPSLEYPQLTLHDAVMRSVARVPDSIAFDFLGYRRRYRELGADIERCAAGLASIGLGAGDRITIAMPTCPQGVIAFYAASRLGAVPAMIHPLSTAPEIEHYLNASGSRIALTLDAFYGKFAEVRANTPLETLVLARIPDCLPLPARLGFLLTKQRAIPRVPPDPGVRWWSALMSTRGDARAHAGDPDELAAILFSGGTTGQPKGIMLSHRNLISEGLQVAAWARMQEGDSILAVLPIFHGFGLGVCINAALVCGGEAIMVPVFSAEAVAKAMRRRRPNLIAGVPTLFDALSRDPSLGRSDLSCLRATFSGADTLPPAVKARFEALVERRGGHVRLLEGYGLTEAVSAIMATPLEHYRPGSIGVPFPDMLAKICRPGTTEDVPVGEEGEICVQGPAVMLGYLDDPEATAATLRTHADGRLWLHTGDLGRQDDDGFFYFSCRLKRMIKSSGFNVYPTQVEAVLYQHPAVAEACVIGVPDESQVERVEAVIVPKSGFEATPALATELIEHCRKHLIKWSCPRRVEFRSDLPRTRVGKIDYKALEQEARSAEARPSGSA